jgi:phosphopantothenoylcysteine decarboxylase/phosphopantothenate--cysteine ligase
MESIPLFESQRIVLGVTGGIAAYKVCTLASQLTQCGAQVDVVMTQAATRFVAPLTFEALTGRPVYTSMWQAGNEGLPTHIAHVGIAHGADLLVIAPATANTMAKLAAGIADNLVTTLSLAARCPVLLAPAMDVGMWHHAATQANVALLRSRGVRFAGPTTGRMASGLQGMGRLPEPQELFGHVRLALAQGGPLAGRHLVVSAGPTREPLDPVRFLSNPSSGRQGYALAQAALDRAAQVTLVSGPVTLATPVGAELVRVQTAEQMLHAVLEASTTADALLMAAAVADYRPTDCSGGKIKKGSCELELPLARTDDILAAVSARRETTGRPSVLVGFAAETSDLLENAKAKLFDKGLDLIVANDVTAPGAGFGSGTNRVVLIGRDGEAQELPLLSKTAVAETVLDRVGALLHAQE